MQNCIRQSFPKIIITNKIRNGPIDELLEKKKELKRKISKEESIKTLNFLHQEIDDIENEIAEICGDKNKNKDIIEDHIGKLSNTNGVFNAPKMWSLKKKIFPKANIVATAKKTKKEILLQIKKDSLNCMMKLMMTV